MALPYEVEVLDICRISPPAGSVSTTILSLSYLDLPFLGIPPIQSLFYYEFHHPKAYFTDTILPSIKHSLSVALQHYYPLAGQLTWPQDSAKPQIVYTDGDSVPVIVAESDYDFQHLSGNHPRNANEFYPLAPTFKEAVSDDKHAPLFAVQVTLFPNKGICIGSILNHVVSDGASFFRFMKLWTTVCASQGNTSALSLSLPFYDRTAIKDPHGIETVSLNDLKIMNITRETYNILKVPIIPADKVRGTLVMKYYEVMKIKQWVLARLKKDKQAAPALHLSAFVLISSFLWVCHIRARMGAESVKEAENQTEYLMLSADCRARLDPPLPETYLGNCVCGIVVKRDRNELIGQDGVAAAAEVIAKAIMNVYSEVVSQMKMGLSAYMSLPPDRFVAIAGSPKFTAYETDFGWGKPKKQEASFIPGAIALSDSPREDGAVEIKLVCDALEMNAFASVFAKSLEILLYGDVNYTTRSKI